MGRGYFAGWQIGLDIQSDSLRAVAVQSRRYGWQLRQWWHYPLPEQTFLINSEQLSRVLLHWRAQLPRRFSLRIALPATLVLQQRFPLPELSLSEQAMGWYAQTKLRHLLPLAEQQMTLDYRLSSASLPHLDVTATRTEVLQQWLNCLSQARLVPQVVDMVPSILRAMAQREGMPPECLLLHHTRSYLLWVSPWQQELQFATYPIAAVPSCTEILHEYQRHSGCQVDYCCFSGSDRSLALTGVRTFQPFTLLQQVQPPLPAEAYTFTLAMGLALRSEDDAWGR